LLRLADVSTTLNVYTQGSAVQKREAVGKVVSMVLPRINTEGQPALPLLPLKIGHFLCGSMRIWGGRWESNPPLNVNPTS